MESEHETGSDFYVFVNHSLSGVGGGQRYVASKAKWLTAHGWKVVICHVENGPVLIDVGTATVLHIIELRCAPVILGKKRVSAVLQPVIEEGAAATRVIVESSALYLGYWGEVIAQRLHGKHLCYILEEGPKPEDRKFLRFKYDRNELAFINSRIAAIVFDGHPFNAERYENCVLTASSPSPFEDVPSEIVLPSADYRILSITRLEKSYVKHMVQGVAAFCKLVPDKRVLFVLIGDGPNQACRDDILAVKEQVDNLEIIITGFVAPISLRLLKSFDLCIGKAGAATNCAREGVITICYSLEEDSILGVVSYDVPRSSSLASETARKQKLEDVIWSVLVDRKWDGVSPKYPYPDRVEVDYSSHISFLSDEIRFDYYDVSKVHMRFSRIIVSWWIKLFKNLKYESIKRYLPKL